MRKTYTLNLWQYSHYLCHHTHSIDKITHTLLWHHTRHMRGIVCIIQDITSSLFDLKTPFWGHHTYYIINHVHCICVITATLSMISQPLYVWYHFQYMGDNLSTIFFISYPLCLTTQPWVLITPHSAYVWQHLCYSRCHIHSMTPSDNLYEFTSTSGMTSHLLIRQHTNCTFVVTISPRISYPL